MADGVEAFVLEATHAEPSGWVFRLCADGSFYRRYDDQPWKLAWVIPPTRVPVEIELLRISQYMRVTVDRAIPSEVPKPPLPKERAMSTIEEQTVAEKEPKPIRMGAKARALLDSLNLPEEAVADTIARATEYARERDDTILRDYYVYVVLSMDMPASVEKRWTHFQESGTELTTSGTGKGGRRQSKKEATDGAEAEESVDEPDAEEAAMEDEPDINF